jgi:CBASS immunity sensor of nucleotide second messenger signals
MIRSGLSSSGARIRGDDYQHLAGWIQVVTALLRGSDVERIGIEDPGHPGADDVTVYRASGPTLLLQAKSAVGARSLASFNWLREPSDRGGPSILQKLHREWSAGGHLINPKLRVLTNRPDDPTDPLLPMRDGQDGTIARLLTSATASSPAGLARSGLAAHLAVGELDLLKFLRDFRFITGRLRDDLVEEARTLMSAAGLRRDAKAVRVGTDYIHDWVTSGERRVRTIDELRAEVDALDISDHPASGILVIQALDRSPLADGAAVALDWVEHYMGDEPRVRRELSDPALWNTHFRGDLRQAAQRLRAQGHRSVLVDGAARLPTWFAAGVELCQTAGFDVVVLQRGELWPSHGPVGVFGIHPTNEMTLGTGAEIAVAISLSREITPDVLPYVQGTLPAVGRYLALSPVSGPTGHAIRGDSEARGCAVAIRDFVRDLARENGGGRLHLFFCCPRGIALLLGNLWDRMPATQLHEDLGARGYLPSFLIPN